MPIVTAPAAAAVRWDLAVIGAGTAGIVAARTAADVGAKVLLIEKARAGGDCLWTGCVPSKAIIAASAAAATARGSRALGVAVDDVRVDYAAVRDHVRGAIAHIEPVDAPETLAAKGIDVLAGDAAFTGPASLVVDGVTIAFRHALLAMGAGPATPAIPGLGDTRYLTSDTIWSRTELPDDLVVIGGGCLGCELGQAFARLGSQVTIVEQGPRLLPAEDPAAAAKVAESLVRDGVRLLLASAVTAVEAQDAGGKQLRLLDGGVVPFGELLVAVGRSPRTRGVGLDAAGVRVDERGFVVTDRRLRTTNPRIWAAGDLTGHPQFTHAAGVHAAQATLNAVLGLRRTAPGAMPRVTFTDPEVAAVGVPTASLPSGHRLLQWPNTHVDRAVAQGNTSGFSRIVADRRGRIVGATIVGPRAGEVIGELVLAISAGLRVRDLVRATHPYPTYSDGPWNAAIDDVRATLRRGPVKTGLRAVVWARRRIRDRR